MRKRVLYSGYITFSVKMIKRVINEIDDEASTAFVTKKNSGSFKHSNPTEVRMGPYVIRGNILCSDRKLDSFAADRNFAVQNAEISCLLPGAQLTGLKVPLVLVVARQKQLIMPLAQV